MQNVQKQLQLIKAAVKKETRRIEALANACVQNFTHALEKMINELQQVYDDS